MNEGRRMTKTDIDEAAAGARELARIVKNMIEKGATGVEWRSFFAEVFEIHGQFARAGMPPEALVRTSEMIASIFRDPDTCESAIAKAKAGLGQPASREKRGDA